MICVFILLVLAVLTVVAWQIWAACSDGRWRFPVAEHLENPALSSVPPPIGTETLMNTIASESDLAGVKKADDRSALLERLDLPERI